MTPTVDLYRRLLRARDLIDAGYAGALDVRTLAGAVHLSAAYFGRSFRRAFDQTPHHYLLTRLPADPAHGARGSTVAPDRYVGDRDLPRGGASRRSVPSAHGSAR